MYTATPEVIANLLSEDLKAVDAIIRSRLNSEVILVRQVADYIIGGGGKRLRPALVILAAGASGYDGRFHHVLAAVVEFIHTATLLHDDVVDDSNMRRGKQAANRVWGNPSSVLVGDFLFARSFNLMVETGDIQVLDILARAASVIAEGEVMQLAAANDADTTLERYMEIVAAKTAALFAAAMPAAAQAITVENAWIMTPPPGATEASAFVTARAGADDRLLGVSCECAVRADLHEMSMTGSAMTMRPLRYGAAVSADAPLVMGPHGIHIMLTGVTAPLQQGQIVPLRLTFRDAGIVTANAEVRRR